MDIHAIITSESGLAALSVALFKRLQKPRAVMGSRIFVNNILKEKLAKWVQPTWQLIGTTTSRREEKTDYLITEWKDVQQLCQFHQVAAPTLDPSQGLGNITATRRGELGIVIPPLRLSHRWDLSLHACMLAFA